MAPLLTLLALGGPFSSLQEYCAAVLRQDSEVVRDCISTHQNDSLAIVEQQYVGGQRLAQIAVHRDAGWFVSLDGIAWDANRGRGSFRVVGLSTSPGVAARVVQSHWRKPVDDVPDEYYCFALEVACSGDAKVPRCSKPLPVAGRRDCDLDEGVPRLWDWEMQVRTRNAREIEVVRVQGRPPRLGDYHPFVQALTKRAGSLGGRWRLR